MTDNQIGRMLDNMTGFTNYEFSMGAKWLEILKEIAPSTARISLMLNPDTGSFYVDYLRSVETVALTHSVQATLAPVHNSDEIENAIAALGRKEGRRLDCSSIGSNHGSNRACYRSDGTLSDSCRLSIWQPCEAGWAYRLWGRIERSVSAGGELCFIRSHVLQ